MPSAIPVIPFLISDYGRFPPLPGPVFSPTAREPFAIFPTSPSEDGDAFFGGVQQLFDRKTSPFRLAAAGIVGKRSCGGGKALGGQIPGEGGACKESLPVL